MNKIKLLLLLTLGMVATSASAAVILTFESGGQLTSTQAGVTTIDFNDNTIGAYTATSLADYTIFPNSASGSAQPFGITSNFLSVPNPIRNGTAEFGLGADYNYFGLYWGSIDTYNTLSFWNDGMEVASYTGSQVAPLHANGGQSGFNSNRYINFFFTGGLMYDTVRLKSTNFAFETDNHSFGVVPEPAIIAIFGLGLLGLGFTRRKIRS